MRARIPLFVATCVAACVPTIPRSPEYDAFLAANQRIETYDGLVGFGNSNAASQLAQRFAILAKNVRDAQFTSGKDPRDSVSDTDQFLTYCQLNSNSACFLVRVPNLERFRDSVRDQLIAACWECAKIVIDGEFAGGSCELAIGMRGALTYGASAIGSFDGPPTIQNSTMIDSDKLYRFFAPEPGPG